MINRIKKNYSKVWLAALYLLCATPAFAATAADPVCAGGLVIQKFFLIIEYGVPAAVGIGAMAGGVYEIKRERDIGKGLGLIAIGIIVTVVIFAILKALNDNAIQAVSFCS